MKLAHITVSDPSASQQFCIIYVFHMAMHLSPSVPPSSFPVAFISDASHSGKPSFILLPSSLINFMHYLFLYHCLPLYALENKFIFFSGLSLGLFLIATM